MKIFIKGNPSNFSESYKRRNKASRPEYIEGIVEAYIDAGFHENEFIPR